MPLQRLYLTFLRGISANRISRMGVVLTTTSVLLIISFEFMRLTGLLTNAYIGLVTYLGFPLVFLLGLVLIPYGWWRHSRKTGRPFMDLISRHFSEEDLASRADGARVFRIVLFLTLANVLIIGAVGGRTLHFMDTSRFCGTACHSVMDPEWTTYQESPHAHVKCVECHVGEGVRAVINSKLNGAWQVISATFKLYEKPIPTPVHTLRPARETCEHCHWPDKFHGNRISTRVHYAPNEGTDPRFTTLMLKIGTGAEGRETGSHWHISAANEVKYASVDDRREEMIWVDVRLPDGSYKRFENVALKYSGITGEENIRTMDCVDCHNRATHIYEDPEYALDERIRRKDIDRKLPFIKSRALGALLGNYADKKAAISGIDKYIRNWYKREYPDRFEELRPLIDEAVYSVQEIYRRNIHPSMDINWGSYPSHLGHQEGEGCFRCHNPDMRDSEGRSISMDCTLCHSILADGSPEPFEFLELTRSSGAATPTDIRRYLREEFIRAVEEDR